MPPIADPYANRPLEGATETPFRTADAPSLRVRVATAVHRLRLTRALAYGAPESQTPELALCARRLTCMRRRRALARTLRRTIDEAHRPRLAWARLGLIRRGAVRDAHDAINELIIRLNGPAPVRAEGMAMVEMMLTNADRSPLYNFCEPGTLRRHIRLARAAMDDAPQSSRGHEFALAA